MGFFGFGKKDKRTKEEKEKASEEKREREKKAKEEKRAREGKEGKKSKGERKANVENLSAQISSKTLPPPLDADYGGSRYISQMHLTEDMQDLSVAEITSFFNELNTVISHYENIIEKRRVMRHLKELCHRLLSSTTTVTMEVIQSVGLDQSHGALELVQRVAEEASPLRARHALALYRFCCVIDQELEDEQLSCQTGFLTALGNYNRQEPADIQEPHVPEAAEMGRCPDLDLALVYQKLLKGGAYLPRAEEMNEIIQRTTALLRTEPNVLSIQLPCVVVGDIHGQINDVLEHILPAGGPLVPEHLLKEQATPDRTVVNYLFLGDYVDRGPSSLQCMCLLFVAKLLSPSTVSLLRGNHESSLTNQHYGFLEECHAAYPIVNDQVTTSAALLAAQGCDTDPATTDPLTDEAPALPQEASASGLEASDDMEWNMSQHPFWVAANEAFMWLPLSAALYEHLDNTTNAVGRPVLRVCAMHGGLSPYIENSIDGIVAVKRHKDIDGGALADLTWSDPLADTTYDAAFSTLDDEAGSPLLSSKFPENAIGFESGPRPIDYNTAPPVYNGPPIGFTFSNRGTGHVFGEDATCAFLQQSHARFIVRAHQCVNTGYQWTHNHRLLTLFSAPNYCGLGNMGAILLLDHTGRPSVVQYSYTKTEAEEGEGEEGSDTAEAVTLRHGPPVPPKDFM